MGEEEAEVRSMLLGYSGTERKSKSLSIFKQRLSLGSGGHLLGEESSFRDSGEKVGRSSLRKTLGMKRKTRHLEGWISSDSSHKSKKQRRSSEEENEANDSSH